MTEALQIPIIPSEKNYWLIRTNGGLFYNDYKVKGSIAINWDKITLEDIRTLDDNELTKKVRREYPDKVSPGKASAQLRTFENNIKKGDTVVITGYASNKFSIGEVLEDKCFVPHIDLEAANEDRKICTYLKRKRVRWIKEVNKYELDMPMFKLLQHARNTVNNANEFGDVIEGLVHDFFIRGENAFFSLKVKRESNIPANDFFKMGAEILDLIEEFGKYKNDITISSEGIITKINVNSEGKAKFIGPVAKVVIGAYIVVICLAGGGFKVTLPEEVGGAEIDIHTNGLLSEVKSFLDVKKEREQKDLLLSTYMEHLEIEAPDELKGLLDAVENQNSDSTSE